MKIFQFLKLGMKKKSITLMILAVFGLFFFDFGVALAQNANPDSLTSGIPTSAIPKEVSDLLTSMVNIAITILKVAYAVLIPILGLIGKFLSNDWVTGSAFNVDIIIELLWQIVRNAVNIAIVFYLLFVAGKNILPFGDGKDAEIKKALPMVVIALILVNFSLFGTRLILNFANLATTIAFSIPQQVVGNVFGNPNTATGQTPYHMFVWSTPISNDMTNALSCDPNYVRVSISSLTNEQKASSVVKAIVDKSGQYVCQLAQYCYDTNTPADANGFIKPNTTCDLTKSRTSTSATDFGVNPNKTPVTTGGTGSFAGTLTGSTSALAGIKLFTPVSQSIVSSGNQNLRQVDCLHRNYAFNFSNSFIAEHGSSIIANPIYVNGTGYTTGNGYYKRFIIQESPSNADGTANKAYDDKMTSVTDWIKKTKANWTAGGLSEADVANGLSGFPYYSDCIMSMDELVFSARNVMFVYAFNLMKVAQYEEPAVNIKDLSGITVRLITTIVYFGFFLLVNIMLLIAVVGRAFYIWAMMILSPVWVLTEVLKMKIASKEAGEAVGGTVRFIKLAFMPAVVGLVLSLGFVMFHYLSYIGSIEGLYAGRLQLGSITLYFDPNGVIISGLGHMFQLMFAFIAVAAVFVATYEAIKFGFGEGNPFMKGVDAVKKFGGDVVKTARELPLQARVIPLPGGGKMNINTAKQLPGMAMASKNAREDNLSRQALENAFPNLVGASGLTPNDRTRMVQLAQAGNNTAGVKGFMDEIRQRGNAPEIQRMQADIMHQIVKSDGSINSIDRIRTKIGNEDIEIGGAALQQIKANIQTDTSRAQAFANQTRGRGLEEVQAHQDFKSFVQSSVFTLPTTTATGATPTPGAAGTRTNTGITQQQGNTTPVGIPPSSVTRVGTGAQQNFQVTHRNAPGGITIPAANATNLASITAFIRTLANTTQLTDNDINLIVAQIIPRP